VKIMENFNKNKIKQLNISDWQASIELLKLDYKRVGTFTYLPRIIVEFLHLNREQDRSLIAFLDSSGPCNFLIVTSDRNLSELLKPVVLQKRLYAERLKQKLSTELRAQQQQQDNILTDVEMR